MSVLDKLKFWKKDDDFGDFSMPDVPASPGSDPLAKIPSSPLPQSPQQLGQQAGTPPPQLGLPESAPGANEPPSFAGEPAPIIPQSSQRPQFDQPSALSQPASLASQPSNQMDLVSSKLDTIKAQLDTVLQRLDRLERGGERPYQRQWANR